MSLSADMRAAEDRGELCYFGYKEKWIERVEKMEKKLLAESERRYNDVMAAKKSGYEEGRGEVDRLRQALIKIGSIAADPDVYWADALRKIGDLARDTLAEAE